MPVSESPIRTVPIRTVPGTGSPAGTGVVYLVGAGPGDPGLITVLGLRCLRGADAVVYDRLVHPALIDEAPSTALRFDVGKAPGQVRRTQEQTQRLLVRLAKQGLQVVRLKGGDPFVYGRGGEEALALTAAGVPWRVVPGITSVVAAPASAGIPLTHRGVASSFAVFTGHSAGLCAGPSAGQGDGQGDGQSSHGGGHLAADTLVALMAVRRLGAFVDRLLAAGRPAGTPAALVERATLPGSRTVVAPLSELPTRAAEAGIHSPATLVVGEVVALRSVLGSAVASAVDADERPAVPTSAEPIPLEPPIHSSQQEIAA